MNLEKIKELYKDKYPFEKFYEIVQERFENNEFIPKTKLTHRIKSEIDIKIFSSNGDIRVDLPIWFGNITSKNRILFLGLEPRDSDDKNNIEKKSNYIFGTPFGIEFWNNKNKYFKSFKSILKEKDILTYFTDVVKHYEVKETKLKSDKHARNNFWKKAALETNITFLAKEFDLIKPTHIISLGNDSYEFINHHFGDKWSVYKLVHPAAHPKDGINAFERIDTALKEMLKSL